MNGASTAKGCAASELGAGQTHFITDYPQQWGIRFGLDGYRRAVQIKTDCHV